jgi:hypothetical protein
MFIFGRSGIEKDENIVQTSVLASALFNAIPEQLDTKRPLIVRNVHQTGHQFERLKLSDVLNQQIDSALSFVPKEDVGIFIYNFSDLVILDIF